MSSNVTDIPCSNSGGAQWEFNYPTTVYSEEKDRYLLCRLNHYGMNADDVFERIKKDITEFPSYDLTDSSKVEAHRNCRDGVTRYSG